MIRGRFIRVLATACVLLTAPPQTNGATRLPALAAAAPSLDAQIARLSPQLQEIVGGLVNQRVAGLVSKFGLADDQEPGERRQLPIGDRQHRRRERDRRQSDQAGDHSLLVVPRTRRQEFAGHRDRGKMRMRRHRR